MTPDGIKRLMLDEGTGPLLNNRLMPYWDDTSKAVNRNNGNGGWLSIAFGRNIGANGLSFAESKMLLDNDIALAEAAVVKLYPQVKLMLPDVWADVLTMIQYNTGNLAGWPHLLLAMKNKNTNLAISELQNSAVYRGVGRIRYGRFCNAVLYRTWAFSAAEDALYNKLVASVPVTG